MTEKQNLHSLMMDIDQMNGSYEHNISRILLQDVRDVFTVIEQRGFEVPKGQ
jgi:hypothetical protein